MFKLILGKKVTFKDLESIDAQLYKQLRELLRMRPDEVGQLFLTFEVAVNDFGKTLSFPLKPDEPDLAVTGANVRQYVSAYASWRMFDSVKNQIESFLEGFYDILPPQTLGLFDEADLRLILGGVPTLNVAEWKENTFCYDFPDDTTVPNWFFEVLNESDDEFRSKILMFATATSRISSFKHIHPKFTLICVGNDTAALPMAATCFNQLKIPAYQSKQILKEKLVKAVEHGAGFHIEERDD